MILPTPDSLQLQYDGYAVEKKYAGEGVGLLIPFNKNRIFAGLMKNQDAMRNIFFSVLLVAMAGVCLAQSEYVNPFVGTAEHGHTFPGAIVPFGAVQVSPDTRLDGWDGCSGYHYSDNRIYGFSHTHLSGTGCSDYGDVLVMPFVGNPSIDPKKYSSVFAHPKEQASPGFYSVRLNNGVLAELTAGRYVAMHRYTFQKNGRRGIIIDLTHRDKVLASSIATLGNEIVGYRRSEAWNPDQYCAFSIVASEKIQKVEYYKDGKLVAGDEISGENCKAIVYFADNISSLTIKVAVSAVDVEGARNNQNEIKGFKFDAQKDAAKALWDNELGKIKVEAKNAEYLKVFYTALYHCFTSPYLYSDLDGRYRGQDGQIHRVENNHPIYTVFSLWDTYRALHPLLNIIDKKRSNDFLYTFLQHYRQGGMLPVWELSAYETWCMIGYHSAPVVLDAFVKDMHPYDANEMLEAMAHSARLDMLGRPEMAKYGYVPSDADNESVSKTLEYAYDDWCIAQFAKAIGNTAVYEEFINRSQNYKNLMDPDGFMHAKANGGFTSPFDPTEVNNNYTEANCWQYSTYVPHDMTNYIRLMGGDEAFEVFLDSLFYGDSRMTGRDQSDITGVIGQYAHGNEPSHHAAYLYNYIGKPWKTQDLTRKIMTELYSSKPAGLCGNEDCGQMSAWYVFSAMGFYPVCPGSNQYVIGYPLLDKVEMSLENGKKFVVTKDKDLPYIQSVVLNGKELKSSFLTYSQINNGGTLEFKMGNAPSAEWGVGNQNKPQSAVSPSVTMVPFFSTDALTFGESITVDINLYERGYINAATSPSVTEIYYTVNGAEPTPLSGVRYSGPLTFTETTTLKAIAYNAKTGASKVVEATYVKVNNDMKLNYVTPPAPQYYAGGDGGLVDGLRGKENWRIGRWQGFPGDFEAVVDLSSRKDVHSVALGCLEDVKPWIFFPSKVEVFISDNGEDYSLFGVAEGIGSEKSDEAKTHAFTVNGAAKGRYLRVKAYSYGKLPEWHVSAGQQSWMFIDEIEVK